MWLKYLILNEKFKNLAPRKSRRMLCRANFIVRRRLKLFAAIFDGFFAKPAG
jgi:hypothetical protein